MINRNKTVTISVDFMKFKETVELKVANYYTAGPNWHYNMRACTITLWSVSGIGAWSCDVYVADNITATYFKTSWYQVP